jgi:hypothetical protein
MKTSHVLSHIRLTLAKLRWKLNRLGPLWLLITKVKIFMHWVTIIACRSQWPRGLRHEPSSLARTLGSWIRIPLKAWMSVCAFILHFCCSVIPVQGVLPTVYWIKILKNNKRTVEQ